MEQSVVGMFGKWWLEKSIEDWEQKLKFSSVALSSFVEASLSPSISVGIVWMDCCFLNLFAILNHCFPEMTEELSCSISLLLYSALDFRIYLVTSFLNVDHNSGEFDCLAVLWRMLRFFIIFLIELFIHDVSLSVIVTTLFGTVRSAAEMIMFAKPSATDSTSALLTKLQSLENPSVF